MGLEREAQAACLKEPSEKDVTSAGERRRTFAGSSRGRGATHRIGAIARSLYPDTSRRVEREEGLY